MENFTYQTKTKILFGKNQIESLKNELTERNVQTLLFVYGRQAIKKLGIYQFVIDLCNTLGIKVIEESGVNPNPDITSVISGCTKIKENSIDFVLAAGGGSVIDAAKAMAFGAFYEGDIWDIYTRKADALKSLPIGVIITLAATGTETNGNSVISNQFTGEKRSVAYEFSIPSFAVIDPTYTLSVDRHHTIAGSIDIIMHVLEQYFSNTLHTSTSDYMIMGLINSVIEQTNSILLGTDNYDVRSNLSWASTIALNWILGKDKIGDWATHRLSYAVTLEFGITHGYALAALFSSWARTALKDNPDTMKPRLSLFGQSIFGVEEPLQVLDTFDKLMQTWGAKVSLKEHGILYSKDMAEKLAANAIALGAVGTVTKIDFDKAVEIFSESLQRG